jgi:uncharacterized protein (DUF169 family)
MTDYAEIAETLRSSLGLERAPIAVCITEQAPRGVRAFEGSVPAGCRFWQEAERGAFATGVSDHASCAVGMHTHGMPLETTGVAADLKDALGTFAELGYVRAEDVPRIPTLQPGTRHVVYAPLASAPLAPDVVLLFVRPAQALILSEAAQQLDPDAAPALGRPACAIVPQAVKSGRAALSLGCCGARAYLDVLADDVALWALPGARLAEYTERIAVLARANGVLAQFHARRRRDFEAGEHPSVRESLARLSS